MKEYRIATILTCFNRKALTLAALNAMYEAQEHYNEQSIDFKILLTVYLTDDGCTDGTSEAVEKTFPDRRIHILKGNGSLYWAGGMRYAWKEALKRKGEWDFFLLMNDDTLFCSHAFQELFQTMHFEQREFGKMGISCGICSSMDGKDITYGGKVYSAPLIGKAVLLKPCGTPQPCLLTNANMLLISNMVVEKIGIFDEHYLHSNADWAYGIEAQKHGFPVYITANICGRCDFDHDSALMEKDKILAMSIRERRAFFDHPLRATKDRLYFMRKYQKPKYILLYLARLLNIYLPKLYYRLFLLRPNKI